MKRMVRLACLVMALVLTLSAVPMTAAAAEDKATVKVTIFYLEGRYYGEYTMEVGSQSVILYPEDYIHVSKKAYAFNCFRVGEWYPKELIIPAYDGTQEWLDKWSHVELFYVDHEHTYTTRHNRHYHWEECDCGDTKNKQKHVDPAKDEDKVCDCGYIFSSNADLVTLWLENMVLSPRFSKNTTEYVGKVHTYRDFKATRIKTETFDALATVELPKDLKLNDGETTFTITVTAEDKQTTKTYTVTAVKADKTTKSTTVAAVLPVEDDTVTAAPKKTVKWRAAYFTVNDAMGLKLAQTAQEKSCKTVAIAPEFSKWGIDTAEFNLSAKTLEAIADTEADLLLKTTYGVHVTVPNDALETLAKDAETVTVTIEKEGTFSLKIDGEEAAAPDSLKITID